VAEGRRSLFPAKILLSPTIPLDTRHSAASLVFPLHTQKQGGVPLEKCRRADIPAFSPDISHFLALNSWPQLAAKTRLPEIRRLGLRSPLENDGGFAAVGGALPFAEAAFLGYAEGGGVIGMNEADGAGIGEAGVAPGEDGGNGFGGVAFAVHRGRKNPAGFAKIFDGRREFAMEIGEADFTGKGGGGFFLEDPEAETEQRPVSGIAEKFDPGFFFGERAAANELRHGGIGPHRAAGGKIFQAMVAEAKARSFNKRKFRGIGERVEHEKILAQRGTDFGMRRKVHTEHTEEAHPSRNALGAGREHGEEKSGDLVAFDRQSPPFAKFAKDGAPVIFQEVVHSI